MELNNLKIYLAEFGNQVTDSYRDKIIKNNMIAEIDAIQKLILGLILNKFVYFIKYEGSF